MWQRVPLLLRVLLAAVAVTGSATVVWGSLIQANLRFYPRLPWAVAVMAVFLWVVDAGLLWAVRLMMGRSD